MVLRVAHVSMFLFPTHWPLGQGPPKAPLSGVWFLNSQAENRSRCKGFELGAKIWRLGAVLKPQFSDSDGAMPVAPWPRGAAMPYVNTDMKEQEPQPRPVGAAMP